MEVSTTGGGGGLGRRGDGKVGGGAAVVRRRVRGFDTEGNVVEGRSLGREAGRVIAVAVRTRLD